MTGHQFIIRPAAHQDLRTIIDLGSRTFADAFGPQNNPENLAVYIKKAFSKKQIASELIDPNSLFFLAFSGAKPVGYLKLRKGKSPACVPGPNPIELERIYVIQDWMGKGLGSALMRTALQAAEKGGNETIWLGVWERNPRAIAFYKRWGFVAVGEQRFKLGSDLQRDLILSRPVKINQDVHR